MAVAEKNGCLDVICAAEPVIREGLEIPSCGPHRSTPSTVSSITNCEHILNTYMPTVHDLSGSVYCAAGRVDITQRFNFDGDIFECSVFLLTVFVSSVLTKSILAGTEIASSLNGLLLSLTSANQENKIICP